MATNVTGAENVGGIYYDVTLETADMIAGQRRVQSELDKTSASLEGLNPKLTLVASAVVVFVVALGAAAIKSAKAADEMRMLAARVEVAAGSFESGATAMAALEAISRRTNTSVEANVEVFNRLNQSIVQMGGSQSDTLNITELLGKAIKVSGASAVEAKSAMLQFGQAMGSGKLQGDELRSLMENAPYLMRKLADGIGVPVGALKNLGAEGKLTSDVVANALSKAAAQINSDFEKFPQTIAGAMDVAIDAAHRANAKLDELTGTSQALTGMAKGLGDVLDKLAQQFGAANDQAGLLGRNKAIASWAEGTKYVLSYVADAADIAWTAISTLGRNVAFVFTGVTSEIGGIGAQIAAVMRGDFAGAKAIGDAMTVDAEERRAALEAADQKALSRAKTANAALYTSAVSAQVAVTASLAAQNAFMATAAIPLVGPELAPAAAAAAGAAATALGGPAIAGASVAGARRYGGPVESGSLYRINETGAPEMYTASNGSQYMLPTSGGQVTAADKVGGSQPWTINIHNAPAGTTASVNDRERTVDIAVATVASQISNNSGQVWSALKGATNVASRL